MKYIDISDTLSGDKNLDLYTKNEESVSNSLRNIINTRKGSVPGNPEFGSNIYSYLFGNINPLSLRMLTEEIRFSLEMWEKRIEIVDITLEEDVDYNRIKIFLRYTLKQDSENIIQDFSYIIKTNNY